MNRARPRYDIVGMKRVRKTRDCQNIVVGMIGFLSAFRVVAVSLFVVLHLRKTNHIIGNPKFRV